jgi:hypothetical protein
MVLRAELGYMYVRSESGPHSLGLWFLSLSRIHLESTLDMPRYIYWEFRN